MTRSELPPDFERDYRLKSFGYFLAWLSWSMTGSQAYKRGIWAWVHFWHREATAPARELRGYEVRCERGEVWADEGADDAPARALSEG